LFGVFRTCRLIPTGIWQKGRNQQLVQFYQ
jgi:hypothetical protein